MDNRKAGIGIFLILLGIMTGLGNLRIVSGNITLTIISLVLLGAYAATGGWKNRASIGFLIPGLIMSSISVFTVIQDLDFFSAANEGFIFLMLLGSSFLLLMPIHTTRFNRISWGEKYWPVFPGSILTIIGVLGLSFGQDRRIWGLVNPIVLISIGLFIIVKPYLNGQHHENSNNLNETFPQQNDNKINLDKDNF